MKRSLLWIGLVLALASPGYAQTTENDALQRRVRALEDQVRALQAQMSALLAGRDTAQAPVEMTPLAIVKPSTVAGPFAPPNDVGATEGLPNQPAPQLPASGALQSGAKMFNPDIGIIGNFVTAGGRSRGGSDTLAPIPLATLQESEASFQSIVDPYARADFFLAIGEEGIEVEEGYLTFTTLPGKFLVKAGKMRANFGRLNAFHNHTLPWIDRPLVMYNLLGGSASDPDTGIKDAGVSVSRLIPAGKLFVEAIGEVYRGDSGALFGSSRRQDFSSVVHLRTYADLTEQTNVEIGASYSRGHNDLGSAFTTQLYGTDVTLRWRPLRRAIYHQLAARAELIWSHRREQTVSQRAFGFYSSLDYQFARRWFISGRYDQSDRARAALIQDRGFSGVLTFWPSEFSQIRSQYRRTRFGDDGRTAHELLFQVLFTIGAHGAHPF